MERLRLCYPIRPYIVNQNFGDNKPCVRNFGASNQEVIQSLVDNTCPVGSDKLYAHFGMSGHNGMDLNAGEQNVYAACDGIVVEQQTVPARGLGLGILTNDIVHLDAAGDHYAKVRYWHLKRFYVNVGDSVTTGQLIGVTDNTGYSSGNHLHFEVQPMDKDVGGHPYLTFPNNQIGAAIDPKSFFTGIYADIVPQQISYLRQLVIVLTAQLQEILKKK